MSGGEALPHFTVVDDDNWFPPGTVLTFTPNLGAEELDEDY